MNPLSIGAEPKSMLPERRTIKPQVKPEIHLTQINDAKLFRIHYPHPRKLVISPVHPTRAHNQLMLLTHYSHKRMQRLTMDFGLGSGLANQEKFLLAKVLKGTFPKLAHFTFEDSLLAQVTAPGYQRVANAIGNLKLLKELNLRLQLNHDPEQSFYYFAQTIKKLGDLTKLSIDFPSGLNISAHVINILAQNILRHKTSLTEFGFSLFSCPNHIDDGINSLTTSLKQFGHLKKLSLDFFDAELSQHNLREIGETLKRLDQLTDLKLCLRTNPYLSTENWQEIAYSIANLASLTRFDLNLSSDVATPTLSEMAVTLSKLTRLASLRLNFYYNTYLNDNSWYDLAHNIVKLTRLTELDLDFGCCMAISDLAFNELALVLHSFQLKSLSLSFSQLDNLSNHSLIALASAIKNSTLLTKCSIEVVWCCAIDQSGIAALITSIGNLKQLTELKLWFNACAVNNNNLEQLGGVMAQLSNISKLDLRLVGCDQVTDNGLGRLLHGVEKLLHLTELTMGLPKNPRVTEKSEDKLQAIINAKKLIKAEII